MVQQVEKEKPHHVKEEVEFKIQENTWLVGKDYCQVPASDVKYSQA